MRRDIDGTNRRKAIRIAAVVALVLITSVVMIPNGSSNGINPRIISLLGIVAVAAIFAFVFAVRRKHRRIHIETKDDRLSSLGLTPLKDGEAEIKRRFGKLPELRHKGSIKKAFTGVLADRELYVFSHVYTVHTGQAPVTVYRTIYAVATSQWPTTHIVPTNRLGHWLRTLLGRRYLKLDLLEFNRRFHVITEDESFAITLLHPDLQRYILDKRTVKWRLLDGWLCLSYGGSMKLDRAPASLGRLERFLELIPPELESWSANVSVDV